MPLDRRKKSARHRLHHAGHDIWGIVIIDLLLLVGEGNRPVEYVHDQVRNTARRDRVDVPHDAPVRERSRRRSRFNAFGQS